MDLNRILREGASDRQWMIDGGCRGLDSDFMFPRNTADINAAKLVCRVCVVKERCLDFALKLRIEHGVWGGTSEDERIQMIRHPELRPTE